MPLRDDHGARIVLLGTDYATLATTAGPRPSASQWRGQFELRNLPPGDYRVLAYRTASQVHISEPIHLESGQQTRLDIELQATSPAGNVIENPDGRLESLQPGVADRWSVASAGPPPLWSSTGAYVAPHTTYRCGAILKDPAAKVQFVFPGRPTPQEQASAAAGMPAFLGRQAPRRADDDAGRPALERDGSGPDDPPLEGGDREGVGRAGSKEQ